MKSIVREFEWLLWNSRFVVVVAVIASVVSGLALYFSHRAEEHAAESHGSHPGPVAGK